MKLVATLARPLQADLQAEVRDIESAVAAGTRDAGHGLKAELRRQVASAALGRRLPNSWRDKHYPNQKRDAASLVYTKASQIIRAFDEGAVIRSRRGRFLAIPTEDALRKGTHGKRISPSTFPAHRFGPLRFLPRPSGGSLLISPQEHEAWDVLLACQGQLRLAPSGQVMGINMDAGLRLGTARRYEVAVAAAGGRGRPGRGVVRRRQFRIIPPTLTTAAYRSGRIAAGHR
jgi:hypothetical protein